MPVKFTLIAEEEQGNVVIGQDTKPCSWVRGHSLGQVPHTRPYTRPPACAGERGAHIKITSPRARRRRRYNVCVFRVCFFILFADIRRLHLIQQTHSPCSSRL